MCPVTLIARFTGHSQPPLHTHHISIGTHTKIVGNGRHAIKATPALVEDYILSDFPFQNGYILLSTRLSTWLLTRILLACVCILFQSYPYVYACISFKTLLPFKSPPRPSPTVPSLSASLILPLPLSSQPSSTLWCIFSSALPSTIASFEPCFHAPVSQSLPTPTSEYPSAT